MANNRGLSFSGLPDDILIRVLLELDPVSLYCMFFSSRRFYNVGITSSTIWEKERTLSSLYLPELIQKNITKINYDSVRLLFNQLFQVSYLVQTENPYKELNDQKDDHPEEMDSIDDERIDSSYEESSFDEGNSFDPSPDPVKIVPFTRPGEKKPIQLLISGVSLGDYYKKPSKDLFPLFLLQDCYGRNTIDLAILKRDQKSLDFVYQCVLLLDQDESGIILLPPPFIWNSQITNYFNSQYKNLNYYFKFKTKWEWAAQCNQIAEFKQIFANNLICVDHPGVRHPEFLDSFSYYSSIFTIAAMEGHVELMQFIHLNANFIRTEIHEEILLSSIAAAVLGGQPKTLEILIEITAKKNFFTKDIKANSLTYLISNLSCQPLSNAVRNAIDLLRPYLELGDVLLSKSQEPNNEVDFAQNLTQVPVHDRIEFFKSKLNESIKNNNTESVKKIMDLDLLEERDRRNFYVKIFGILQRYLVHITKNFETIHSNPLKVQAVKEAISGWQAIFSNTDFFSDEHNQNNMAVTLFRWIIKSTLISHVMHHKNQVIELFKIWENSLDFILSLSLFPKEKFLSCLFESLFLFYLKGDEGLEQDTDENTRILYINLLNCFINRGLDVNHVFKESYGTGSLLSINLTNEYFDVINDLLLSGAKIKFEDYLLETTASDSTFTGFICNSKMVEDKTDFKSAIQFKQKEPIPFKKIHLDYFITCMNFDMISAITHFIFMVNYKEGDYFSYGYEIREDDNDVTISLKSLQLEIANNQVLFEVSFDRWISDPFNDEVMSRKENKNLLDSLKWLLRNYNLYYEQFDQLYSHLILKTENKMDAEDMSSLQKNQVAHAKLFGKRSISTSQLTDHDVYHPEREEKKARLSPVLQKN